MPIPSHLKQAVIQVNEPERLEEMNRELTVGQTKARQRIRARWFESWNLDLEEFVEDAIVDPDGDTYFSQEVTSCNLKDVTNGNSEAPSQSSEDGSDEDSNTTENVSL